MLLSLRLVSTGIASDSHPVHATSESFRRVPFSAPRIKGVTMRSCFEPGDFEGTTMPQVTRIRSTSCSTATRYEHASSSLTNAPLCSKRPPRPLPIRFTASRGRALLLGALLMARAASSTNADSPAQYQSGSALIAPMSPNQIIGLSPLSVQRRTRLPSHCRPVMWPPAGGSSTTFAHVGVTWKVASVGRSHASQAIFLRSPLTTKTCPAPGLVTLQSSRRPFFPGLVVGHQYTA